MTKIKKIVLSGIFLALLLVLSRFLSIKTQLLTISFSFVPIMMSAILLGPKYSLVIAGLGDLIGALLFPFGTYFPGFTASYIITGLIYGLFLYKKVGQETSDKLFIIKLTISSGVVLLIVNLFLNSLWLHILYGSAYMVVLSTRLVAQIIMLPIQVIVIFLLEKYSRPYVKKYILDEE